MRLTSCTRSPGVEPGDEDRVVVGRRDARVVEGDVDAAVRLMRRGVDALVVLGGLVTSAWTKMPPTSSATASPASSLMSTTTTFAPSDARRRAEARPMPLAAAGDDGDPVLQSVQGWLQSSVAMKTFLVSVNASRASGPSSRPRPDCLKPPNGVE